MEATDMDRKEVESSQLKSVGYDAEKQVLEIEFKNGGVYQYFDVPEHIHRELMAGTKLVKEGAIEKASIGRYFGQQVRGKFKFAKLPPAPEAAKEASTT
jgi:hypothetical protein